MALAFESLQLASIFTKLALHSAYNLIWVRQEDRWKTTFIMPSGHYEYLVMPFRFMNAVFHWFINEVLNHYICLLG